jgi:hypothetical protein
MVLLTAAQIRAHADLSGYVPYTGATGAVNLGANALTVGAITASGVVRVALDSIAAFRVGTIDGITNGLGSRYGTACNIYAVGVNHTCFSNTGILTRSDRAIGWSNVTDPYTDSDLLLRRGGAGILEQRNGTNAQIFTIEKTYTSSTSREYIQSGWNATDSAYDVGVSYQGSAGGSLQAVRIGNRTAAGVFSGLTVATSGAVTASGQITTGSAVAGQTYGIQVGNGVAASSDFSYLRFPTNWGNIDFKSWGGALGIYGSGLSLVTAPRFVVDSTGRFGAASGSAFSASTDATLSRASAGVWQMGTTADNALGSLNLANLTASGTILTRNGTSPTSIQITNTYTSATSFGLLDIRANAAQTAYEISSFLGSAGGANLPINIGHRDSAGTFTSALSVGVTGRLLVVNPTNSRTVIPIAVFAASASSGNYVTISGGINNGDPMFIGTNYYTTDGELRLGTYTSPNAISIKVNGLVSFIGQVTEVPPASVTLATNGQFSIEMTSNTAGNLVYRGSDGTTRRAALVFV